MKSSSAVTGFVALILFTSQVLFGHTRATATEIKNIDEIKVGIVGKNLIGYGCWPSAAKGRSAQLQVRVMGQWITKVKAKVYRDSSLCSGANPWTAMYSWKVDEFGESQNTLSRRARDTFLRQYLPKSGKSKAITRDAFLLTIYKSEVDQALDFNDILKSTLNSGM